MPELLEVGGGWLYWGEVRLNVRRVNGTLCFPVKEYWLRPEHGEHVEIPISEFTELEAKSPSQAP